MKGRRLEALLQKYSRSMMSSIGKKIEIQVSEPWGFQSETNISVIHGRIENEQEGVFLIALSEPIKYKNTSVSKVVVAPVTEKKVGIFKSKKQLDVDVIPVIDTVKLQPMSGSQIKFTEGSEFHRAFSWRGWSLRGDMKV